MVDLGDHASVGAVLLNAFDSLGLHVRPADLLSSLVEVETVRYADVLADDHFSMRAVHVSSLDLGMLAVPVGPENVSCNEKIVRSRKQLAASEFVWLASLSGGQLTRR